MAAPRLHFEAKENDDQPVVGNVCRGKMDLQCVSMCWAGVI